MIWDCFMFLHEFDLLEIRLRELEDVVDRFVIVEATETFSGLPKPLYFAENRARYARWDERFVHVVVDRFPPGCILFCRDRYQRDACMHGLGDANPADTVLIGDLDEIPRADLVSVLGDFKGMVTFMIPLSFYKFNCRALHMDWPGTRAVRRRDLVRPQATRETLGDIHLSDAGWHFTYLGDAKFIQEKVRAYSHQEVNSPAYINTERLQECIREGRDWGEAGLKFAFVPFDATFPRFVVENRERYAQYIAEVP
jgi:beta-1,4-mannosyl-glycoprotein beta-1,4-N-acetylglucosaminyltransferase